MRAEVAEVEDQRTSLGAQRRTEGASGTMSRTKCGKPQAPETPRGRKHSASQSARPWTSILERTLPT
eukprot:10629776-Alexandrium_andersonii.AAC.1